MSSKTAGVPKLDQYDVNKITITVPKKNTTGKGQTSYVNTEQFSKHIIFEVNGKVSYKLAPFREEGKPAPDYEKYNLHLEYDENNPSIAETFEAIKKLEKRVAQLVAKKSEEWLFDEKTPEEVKGMIESCISKHRNKKTGEKFPDTLRVRCPVKRETGEMMAKFLDGANGNKPINVTTGNSEREIPRGTSGIFHIRVSKIWFSNKIGLTLTLLQASVNRPKWEFELPEIGVATNEFVGREEEETESRTGEKKSSKKGKMPKSESDDDEEYDTTVEKLAKKLTVNKSDEESEEEDALDTSPPPKKSKNKTNDRKARTKKVA